MLIFSGFFSLTKLWQKIEYLWGEDKTNNENDYHLKLFIV